MEHLSSLLSDPYAVMYACWRRCCWGFHVSGSPAIWSHDNRIHCCCCINHWIQIPQGFAHYMQTFPLIEYITTHHKLLFSRATCCLHLSAMTPVLSWAYMDSLDYWDGWHIWSYRLKTAIITQRKDATNCNCNIHKRWQRCNIWSFFRRAIRFAVFHICTLLITITLSLSMGIITGTSSL